MLNRIKIRKKFSRFRYVKVTGGVSVDGGWSHGVEGCEAQSSPVLARHDM